MSRLRGILCISNFCEFRLNILCVKAVICHTLAVLFTVCISSFCWLNEENRMYSNSKCLHCFLAIIGGGLLHGVCPELSGKAAGLTDRTTSWEGMHESSQPIFDTDALLKCNAKFNRDTLPSSSDKLGTTGDNNMREMVKDVVTSAPQKVAAKQASKSRPGDLLTLEKVTKKKDTGES